MLCRRFTRAWGCAPLSAGRAVHYAAFSGMARQPRRPATDCHQTVTAAPPPGCGPVTAVRPRRTIAPPEPFTGVETSDAAPVLPEEMRMKSGLLIVVGTLIAVAGIVFGLQGLGYIGGTGMSWGTFWAVLGPLIALAGAST